MAEKVTDEVGSICKKSYVKLERSVAIVCLILNCIPGLGGLGTMISACVGKKFNVYALCMGLLQWIL